jgi:hypothetical protein
MPDTGSVGFPMSGLLPRLSASGEAGDVPVGLGRNLCCSRYSPYGIYDHVGTVNLNVVAATARDS